MTDDYDYVSVGEYVPLGFKHIGIAPFDGSTGCFCQSPGLGWFYCANREKVYEAPDGTIVKPTSRNDRGIYVMSESSKDWGSQPFRQYTGAYEAITYVTGSTGPKTGQTGSTGRAGSLTEKF